MASINIRCIPDNSYAIIGVVNNKRARFEIETKKNEENAEATKRNPINLVLVLDRSGSMASNNKLEFAKKAVISVLDLLHDDDVVHLVAYDDSVWNVFENACASTRQVLYSVVNGIKTGGSTFLSGGIEAGAKLFEKYVHPGYSKRMFVLSDGLANVGLQTKDEIMKAVTKYNENGIIIDSFGVGEDFDEAMMKGIAEAGRGQFFFLESAEVIVTLITKALQSVFDVCGTKAQLIIRGRNDAIVTKIWGHENIALGANLGDLHADNLRAILCDFTASATVPDGTEVEVLDYQLKYNRPDDVEGEPLIVSGQLSLTFVNDESFIQEIHPKVKILHTVQVAGEMDDRIAQLIDSNKRDDAIALITEQINLLRQVEHLDDERGMIAITTKRFITRPQITWIIFQFKKRYNSTTSSTKLTSSYFHHVSSLPFVYKTLSQSFDETAAKYPDHECYIFKSEQKRYTFKSLKYEVDSLAASLMELGFEKGDRFAVWLANTSENVAVAFAASKLGLIKVNINPAYVGRELEYCINKVGCKGLLLSPTVKIIESLSIFRRLVPELDQHSISRELSSKLLPTLKHVILTGKQSSISGLHSYNNLIEQGKKLSHTELNERQASINPDSPVAIYYTSVVGESERDDDVHSHYSYE
ncbi:unnamed protein product [Rotaria sordida]|uniref:VWFA domain-containing protein n=1 Tax=Rotaria sordida TaxID=392033 RepID=A0A813UEE6_9BILA|nr:unnamed protein product [Rotaria sordida]